MNFEKLIVQNCYSCNFQINEPYTFCGHPRYKFPLENKWESKEGFPEDCPLNNSNGIIIMTKDNIQDLIIKEGQRQTSRRLCGRRKKIKSIIFENRNHERRKNQDRRK